MFAQTWQVNRLLMKLNVPIIVERLQNIAVIQSGYRINVITLVIKWMRMCCPFSDI